MNRRQWVLASVVAGAASGVAAAGERRSRELRVALELINAFIVGDIDGVMNRLTPDIHWHSHVGSPPIRGRDAMRKVIESLKTQMLDTRWRIVHHAQSGNRLLVEAVDEFRTPSGVNVALPYMGIFVFRNGLISEWRDYFDRALYDRLKSGEAAPEYVAELAKRPGIP
jgi:limonene-1,2-epoxide hydrolase